jgi:hypothetical protein
MNTWRQGGTNDSTILFPLRRRVAGAFSERTRSTLSVAEKNDEVSVDEFRRLNGRVLWCGKGLSPSTPVLRVDFQLSTWLPVLVELSVTRCDAFLYVKCWLESFSVRNWFSANDMKRSRLHSCVLRN